LKQSEADSERVSPPEPEVPSVETLAGYLDKLGSAAPTPGGGSAATVVAALAAALVAMVARITYENPKFASVANEAGSLAHEADSLRRELLEARSEDEAAYGAVVAAMALPRADAGERAQRTAALQAALGGAAAAPLHAAGLAVTALRLAARAGALGNANLQSDVVCAAAFARAALEAAAANVRVNHHYMKDAETIGAQEAALCELERAGAQLYARANRRPGP
jgi:formiminotetrahydrofolate cyclodeaminase